MFAFIWHEIVARTSLLKMGATLVFTMAWRNSCAAHFSGSAMVLSA